MKIDNTAILQAAINILNTKGLSALSMRALADQLNVKAASLYFHIKNKDELLEQISEGISERVYTHLESMKDPDLRQLMTVFRDELKNIQDSPQIFFEYGTIHAVSDKTH
ncbi:TetR/AcrR family transcriptional regulator [Secundilactobacillus collinoides]|uniref:TetR/AcrR family transcriptional regulator n=1 Tax=Secundilactobacillus collinoides TaxID=33960 RepID=UPI0006D23CD2|nr:helix-turn-helix domain-containing protein [Secundilactobacillus collinoides]